MLLEFECPLTPNSEASPKHPSTSSAHSFHHPQPHPLTKDRFMPFSKASSKRKRNKSDVDTKYKSFGSWKNNFSIKWSEITEGQTLRVMKIQKKNALPSALYPGTSALENRSWRQIKLSCPFWKTSPCTTHQCQEGEQAQKVIKKWVISQTTMRKRTF